jgi:hypothetical protein
MVCFMMGRRLGSKEFSRRLPIFVQTLPKLHKPKPQMVQVVSEPQNLSLME